MRIASLSLLLFTACSTVAPTTPWPTHTWPRATPEEVGIDGRRLAAVLDLARAADAQLHEILIVRHGRLVLQAPFFPYDGVRPHDVASVTKTLTALAVGRALATGTIGSRHDTLLSFFPGASIQNDGADKRAITLADVLTMRSGLACPGDATALAAMLASPDPVQYGLDLPMDAPPGALWAYCGTGPHLLSAVVGRTTGMAEDAWLRAQIFDRIGVGEVIWPHDAQGVAHGWGDARLHAQDLARIGLLLLHDGSWDGQTILDPGWVHEATTNQVGSSGPPGGYGDFVWTDENGDSFYANGRGGQFVFVMPSEDLVVVTLGSASPEVAAQYGALLRSQLLPLLHDQALPPDDAADALLADAVARAAAAPGAIAPSPPPAIAADVTGSRYATTGGPLGWSEIAIQIATDHATLEVTVAGARGTLDIGLDGVPRITRGALLDTDPRHDDLDVAALGRWTSDTSFEVTFDTIDRVDAGTLTFTFTGDDVSVDVYERTYLLTHVTFDGHRTP